ncbi:MAG: hypothetical protein ACLFQK_10825 [Fibrobacterota bacterium]
MTGLEEHGRSCGRFLNSAGLVSEWSLLVSLVEEARDSGYSKMVLESGKFMRKARKLYQSPGFRDTDIYESAESPHVYHEAIYCMELELTEYKGV